MGTEVQKLTETTAPCAIYLVNNSKGDLLCTMNGKLSWYHLRQTVTEVNAPPMYQQWMHLGGEGTASFHLQVQRNETKELVFNETVTTWFQLIITDGAATRRKEIPIELTEVMEKRESEPFFTRINNYFEILCSKVVEKSLHELCAFFLVNNSAGTLIITVRGKLRCYQIYDTVTTFEAPPKHREWIQWSNNGTISFHVEVKRQESNTIVFDANITSWFQLTITDNTTVQCKEPCKQLSGVAEKQEHEAFLRKVKQHDYFEILEVSSDAPQTEIYQSYERLMKIHHPDNHVSSLESMVISHLIQQAYDILKDKSLWKTESETPAPRAIFLVNNSSGDLLCTMNGKLSWFHLRETVTEVKAPPQYRQWIHLGGEGTSSFHLQVQRKESNELVFNQPVTSWFHLIITDGASIQQKDLSSVPTVACLPTVAILLDFSGLCAVFLVNESDDNLIVTVTGKLRWNHLRNTTTKIEAPPKYRQWIQLTDEGTASFHLEVERKASKKKVFDENINSWFQLVITGTTTVQLRQPCKDLTIVSEQQERKAFLARIKNSDYYKILEVSRHATKEEIHNSYLRLMRIHHPDRNGGSLESTITSQLIQEAYQFLTDDSKRMVYDKTLDDNEGNFSYGRWSSLLNDPERLKYFIGLGIVAGRGLTLIVLSVPSGPAAIVCSAGLRAGIAGMRYMTSEEAAKFGIDYKKFGTILLTNLAVGVVNCGTAVSISGALPNAIKGSLLAAAPKLLQETVAGAATSAINSGVANLGDVLAKAAVEDKWKGKTALECASDAAESTLSSAVYGAGLGAIAGFAASWIGNGGISNTGADEAAASGGFQDTWHEKVKKALGGMAEVAKKGGKLLSKPELKPIRDIAQEAGKEACKVAYEQLMTGKTKHNDLQMSTSNDEDDHDENDDDK